MKHDGRVVAVALTICLAFSVGRLAPARAQTPAAAPADATLVVAGDVTQPLTIKAAELKAMPRTSVTVSEEGREISYEGVLVGELLKRAGARSTRMLQRLEVVRLVKSP